MTHSLTHSDSTALGGGPRADGSSSSGGFRKQSRLRTRACSKMKQMTTWRVLTSTRDVDKAEEAAQRVDTISYVLGEVR